MSVMILMDSHHKTKQQESCIIGEMCLLDICGQGRPRSDLEVMKLFSCSTQLSMKFVLLINLKLLTIVNSFLLKLLSMKISLLINI